jgi:hypothetical protein
MNSKNLFVVDMLTVFSICCCAYPNVVVSSSAPEVERFAAQELQHYLGNMSIGRGTASSTSYAGCIAVGYEAAIQLGLKTVKFKTKKSSLVT